MLISFVSYIVLIQLLGSCSAHSFPVQFEEFFNQRVHFVVPSNPVGIIVLFHGCQHSGGDFFRCCEDCLGLPEELAISDYAVDQKLVTVALTSNDRFTGCWGKEDIQSTINIIHSLKSRFHLTTLFAIGASSGGAFLSKLATFVSFTSISIQIMACSNTLFNSKTFPSVEFVTMPRDRYTESKVMKNIDTCKARNIYYKKRQCLPLVIDEMFFYMRSGGQLSMELSQQIYHVLISKHFIDQSTGHLVEDPRESEWRMALERADPEIPDIYELPMVPDESAISEVLNVAWAMHEICSTGIEETFLFFKQERDQIQHRDRYRKELV